MRRKRLGERSTAKKGDRAPFGHTENLCYFGRGVGEYHAKDSLAGSASFGRKPCWQLVKVR
jgi:hypothetical protein